MKVSDLMTTPVVTVTPEATFKVALERLLDTGVSSLPVVDADGRLVGIVTEADLVSKEAYGGRRRRPIEVLADLLAGGQTRWAVKARALTVGQMMSRHVETAGPDEDVRAVARRMVEGRLKRVPVIDEDRVVGILSRRDLLSLFHRPDEDIRATLVQRLADPLWAPEDAHTQVEVTDGVVTLTGSVRYPMDRPLTEALAWGVPGVVGVRNHLDARERDPRTAPV